MTVKNALVILDEYIKKKKEFQKGFSNPQKPWNVGNDNVTKLAHEISEGIKTDLIVLNALQKQLKPNCKHPKKLHDRDGNGNLYCMGCNLDL